MSEKNDNDNKPKKKSIIASLDLKNYKPKYTDTFGNGKPNEIELDNFLEAEPDKKKTNEKTSTDKKPALTNKEKVESVKSVSQNSTLPVEENKPQQSTITTDKETIKPVSKVSVKKEAIIKPPEKSEIKPKLKKADDDFERRVNAEADNDFYDEKPNGMGTTFRAGKPGKKINDDESENKLNIGMDKLEGGKRKLNLREPIKVNVRHEINEKYDSLEGTENNEMHEEHRPPRRVETYGVVISTVALVYAVTVADKALVFLSLSLLMYLIRPIAALPFGKYGQSVQNALKGFSIALFFGAIFFAFFY